MGNGLMVVHLAHVGNNRADQTEYLHALHNPNLFSKFKAENQRNVLVVLTKQIIYTTISKKKERTI